MRERETRMENKKTAKTRKKWRERQEGRKLRQRRKN